MDDIAMFDNSLSLLWRAPITDQTGASGCSAFDFDADGAYELLYQGEYAFAILDGATGHEHFRWDGHRSVTWMEYPVVADVDDDGSAEVIVASYPREEGDFGGITVFGHADNGWPPAGPYWGISDYAPLRVRPDGTVESPTPDWWNTYNLFKGRPPGDGVPDLVAVEGEVCVASCEEGGLVKVSWGIANQGHVDATGPVSVTLYALNGDAATALQTVQFPDDVRYRYQAPGGTFELSVDEWGDGIRIVVDDDGTGVGTVDECNEDNNAFEIIGPICPIS
jgi:hypothetical protein